MNPLRIYPLSECAITVEFGITIDPVIHQRVIALSESLNRNPFPGMEETVPSYASLTTYFNPMLVRRFFPTEPVMEAVRRMLITAANAPAPDAQAETRALTVPVCYDPSLGTDLPWVAEHCGISPDEVVQLHCSTPYRVYMIGFVPGFPYLGITHAQIEVPRKSRPAAMVPKGSIGLAGRQTGIYPADIPGGWQIIGRTPLTLFDPEADPCTLFQVGMNVRFVPVGLSDYHQMAEHGTTHT